MAEGDRDVREVGLGRAVALHVTAGDERGASAGRVEAVHVVFAVTAADVAQAFVHGALAESLQMTGVATRGDRGGGDRDGAGEAGLDDAGGLDHAHARPAPV